MKGEKVFPFQERSDYSLSAWISDSLNIYKQRLSLGKKSDAFLVYSENAAELMAYYCDGFSPMEAFVTISK